MGEFRIATRARADLIDIYEFSEQRFGAYQARAYYAGLIRTFSLIADFPEIGQRADHLKPGYRRIRFQAHLIFYTTQTDHIEVRTVQHSARDIRPELFE